MKPSIVEGLRERRRGIIAGGGEEKMRARHEKGLMTARERLGALFQPDTFQEIGMHIRHSGRHFGSEDKEIPADAVITGTGYVDGQQVAAISQDFTVAGGTVGKMHAKKIVELMKFALKLGIPFVAFKDSGGAASMKASTPCPVTARSSFTTCFYPASCRRSPSYAARALEEQHILQR